MKKTVTLDQSKFFFTSKLIKVSKLTGASARLDIWAKPLIWMRLDQLRLFFRQGFLILLFGKYKFIRIRFFVFMACSNYRNNLK